MKYSAKKLTTISICVSLAMILSFVESFVPVMLPGIKLGLANSVTLFLLYTYGAGYGALVALVRIFLSTLLFGAFPTALIFSFSGFVLSFAVMTLAKRFLPFGIVGVSVLGGVFHNLGQVIAACVVMETAELALYFIPLLASGTVAGVAVGVVSGLLLVRLQKVIKK